MATRRERVVLELEDNFTPGMARAAAATAVLKHELNSLSGQSVQTARAQRDLDSSFGSSGREIDKYSGRLRLLADTVAILGPGLVTMGAVGVPAVLALSAALGTAAAAGGTAIIAFQGVGDALGALDKARMQPTVANITAADVALRQLGPDARNLAVYLEGLSDEWYKLRDAAASGLLPGAQAAIDNLLDRAPQAARLLHDIGQATGDMLEEGAASLASDRWDHFFNMVAHDTPPAIVGLARATGDLAHAAGELFAAFSPVNMDALAFLVTSADRIDKWATALDKTQGFQEFIAYVRENGPQVGETLGAVANALLQIVEASAPLGGPVLKALEAVANIAAVLADSPLGPPIMAAVTALSIMNRTLAVTESLGKRAWVSNVRGAEGFAAKAQAMGPQLGKAAAAATGLAIASSGIADGMGLSNTASLALMGTLGGPWGTAAGAAVGLMLDLSKSTGGFKVEASELTQTLDQQTGAITESTRAWVANQAFQQGVLDAARDLGLSLPDVVDAMLGQADAQARVNAGLKAGNDAMRDADGRLKVGTEEWQKYGQNTNLVKDAIGETGAALDEGQRKVRLMSDAMAGAADSTDTAKTALEQFVGMVARANRLLSERAGLRDYQAALDDFTKGLKENGKTLDINTEKGRANQAALDNIAQTALKVAENLKGADRVHTLRQAREDFIDAATQAGMAKDKAVELANQLGLIGRIKAEPTITVNNKQALDAIRSTSVALQGLNSKTIYLTTVERTIHQESRLPGINHARGGYISGPGTSTSDSIPAWLSDGEYVMRASAVAKYGVAMMDMINARRFANGGRAGTDVLGSPGGPKYPAGDPGQNGYGSDLPGGLAGIAALLAGSDFGRGLMRHYQKAIDEIQREISKNNGKLNKDIRDNIRDLHKEIRQNLIERNRATRQGIRHAIGGFGIDPAAGAAAAGGELSQLQHDILAAGGTWTKLMDRQSDRIGRLSERYDAQAKAAADSQKALDDLTAKADSFGQAVANSFNTDVFGGNLAGLDKGLHGDISNIGAMQQTLAALQAAGLDPTSDFYKGLAQSGNLTLANQLLASGPGGVQQYAALYAQRSAAQQSFGAGQEQASFGQAIADAQTIASQDAAAVNLTAGQIRDAVQDLRTDLKQTVPHRIGAAVGKEINDAAGNAGRHNARNGK